MKRKILSVSDREIGRCLKHEGNGVNPGRGNRGRARPSKRGAR
jgi:hypothetical protein